jgi:hypothetical protein
MKKPKPKTETTPKLDAATRRLIAEIAEIKATEETAPRKLIVEFGPDPLLDWEIEFWRRTRGRRYW